MFSFERKINYYETDRMGIVHHSNYIRFLEEARCAWLEEYNMPFEKMEEEGITIPVLGVNIKYKTHVTVNDIIIINLYIKEFSGVRMTVGYNVIEKESKKVVLVGETKHCFTSKELKPLNMKKYASKYYEKFHQMLEEDKKQ